MQTDLVVCDLMTAVPSLEPLVERSLGQALAENGYTFGDGEIAAVSSLGTTHAIRLLLSRTHRPPPPWRMVEVEAVHRAFVRSLLTRCHEPRVLKDSPQAERTLGELRRMGMRVAFDSGLCRPLVNVVLDRLGWRAGVVDATSSATEVQRARPFADAIWDLSARLGLGATARIAKVGSSPADMQQGACAGCSFVIGVASTPARRQELHRYPCTRVVERLSEVPALLAEAPSLAATSLRAGLAPCG